MTDSSPSVPVESREQPSGGISRSWHPVDNPYERQTPVDDATASAGNLQPMSDPYRVRPKHRAIAASLYDNWRCACGWNGDDFWVHIQAELDSIAAQRDRARDLAAHLEAEQAETRDE